MPRRPTPATPSRTQLLLASLCLFVGVFAALKAGIDYLTTSTIAWPYAALALLGLALGGQVLRRIKDSR